MDGKLEVIYIQIAYSKPKLGVSGSCFSIMIVGIGVESFEKTKVNRSCNCWMRSFIDSVESIENR